MSIVVAVVAVLLGFLILRDIRGGSTTAPAADGGATTDTVVTDTIPVETTVAVTIPLTAFKIQVANASKVSGSAGQLTTDLQGRGYIEQRGRDDGPGQAVLWGTTPLFLEKLGINSVDELPPLAEFVPDAEIVEALEATLRITPIEAESGGAGGDAPTSDD